MKHACLSHNSSMDYRSQPLLLLDHHQSNMSIHSSTQLYILTCFMLLNAFLTPAGMIYGWTGLYQMLKDDAEYSSKCGLDYAPNKTCASQDVQLNTIYTVGISMATLSSIVYGLTLNRFGVRANSISGALFVLLGFVILAFSTSCGEHPFEAFIPGFSCIAFGGIGTYLPSLQFSSLYSRPTLMLSIQNALFGAAGLTFTFLGWLQRDRGISRKTSFLWYAGIVVLCAISMLLLYPKKAYKAGDQVRLPILDWLGIETTDEGETSKGRNNNELLKDEAQRNNTNGREEEQQDEYAKQLNERYDVLADGQPASKLGSLNITVIDGTIAPTASATPTATKQLSPSEKHQLHSNRNQCELTSSERDLFKSSRTLKEEILNSGTILLSLYYGLNMLACNLYNANISTILNNSMGDSSYEFSVIFIFIASLFPILFSIAIHKMQKEYGYKGTTFIANTCLIISFALLFISNKFVQLPGFFFFSSGRSLFITLMFSFVGVEYRHDHYGHLIAFITAVCALIGFIQLGLQPLLAGPADNHFDPFAVGMIVAVTSTYSFAYWCWRRRL